MRAPAQTPTQEFEAVAAHLYAGTGEVFGLERTRRTRSARDRQPAGSPEWTKLSQSLTMLLLRDGDIDGALGELERMSTVLATKPAVLQHPEFQRLRGLVYLRQAEVENCVRRHNAECCVFPLVGGGVHQERVPAAEAMASFRRWLEKRPDDLRARWLLCISAMALGEYPASVPEQWRVPTGAMSAEEPEIHRFRDVASRLGVDDLSLCGGVIADDFDGDGLLDVVTSTIDPSEHLTYHGNVGDGTFADRTANSGLEEQLGGLNIVGADYDNDGDLDILVLRGAWLLDEGQIRNSLLRNNGDGTFSDVTRAAGLAEPAAPTQVGVWADFDGDGDLDLFVGNESRADPQTFPEQDGGNYPSQLFRNRGDGTFAEVAAAAGVTNDRYCKGATAGDFDNDGDIDLYVSNAGDNRLYTNAGDGTFIDRAEELGVLEPSPRSFATWFFDYDNDGNLDLFVAGYGATLGDIVADLLGQPHRAVLPRLYRNTGGAFTDVTATLGLDHAYLPMGASFGDLDNDGWLDIYLTTGEPSYEVIVPNIMLRNRAGRGFADVTYQGGFGHLQKGHGVAFADLDNDGDQDVYNQLGGFYKGDAFHNALYENPGHGNHHLTLRLIGTTSNRSAYGARIHLGLETPAGTREIHRAVGSVSSFGGSPARQEIGLGDATAIRRLEVHWPVSNRRQSFQDVPVDSFLELSEDADSYRVVDLESFGF